MDLLWEVEGLREVKGVGREVRRCPTESNHCPSWGRVLGDKSVGERGGDGSWGQLWLGRCRENRAEP